MQKTICLLTDDYWHPRSTIEPLAELLFDRDDTVLAETDPAAFYGCDPDLLISFKDPIENDQIPTPIWCDAKWTETCLARIRAGMGFLVMHAALTDLPESHPLVQNVIRSMFVTHPEQCPVTFVPDVLHPLLTGVEAFTFPTNDEHYVMQMLAGLPTQVLAHTESKNGRQPALWTHSLGMGRICCMTPAHTTENLTAPQFLQLMRNAVQWCIRD